MLENGAQRIGDYEILGTLGAGGMGQVYRVRNVISDRIEAMKILLPDLAGRKELGERFLREIKLVASLNHPNIASLCTALTIENRLIMVMEFIDGVTLSDLIDRGAISVPDALYYLDQALAALNFAHSKGVIHRDIKPANMMLTGDGTIKLMDFGIARVGTERALTQTGTTLGSVDYMSPEQITGQQVDARSDIYSMGVSLYEMVTGKPPFHGTSDFELMAAHVNLPPRPLIEIQPWLPVRLNEIVLQAISKSPDDRFQSAEEFRAALRTVDVGANPAPVSYAQRTATMVEMRSPTIVEPHAANFVRGAQIAAPVMTAVARPLANSAPAPLAMQPSSLARNRKLLLGGGSLLVLAAAATPVYLVHSRNRQPEPAKLAFSAPQPSPAVQPAAPTATPKPKPEPKHLLPPNQAVLPDKPRNLVSPQPAPITGPVAPSQQTQAKLDEVEAQIDGLSSRAAAVNNSLNIMQRSMQSDGLGLRGDMVAKQASMNTNLAKAQQALAMKDADRADRFAGLTELDVSALEKFLGR